VKAMKEASKTAKSIRLEKIITYLMLSVLVLAWGLDYVGAKIALGSLNTFILLFFRYCLALIVVFAIKMIIDRKFYLSKKDIPIFILCALTGEVGYFYLEYTAIGYLPLSILTLILSCVPIVSIIIEKFMYGKKITPIMVLGVLASLVGVAIIIGADFKVLFQGKIIGYLLAFGAVISWNAYNFLTAKLHKNYSDVSLSLFQIICTTLILAPYALTHIPEASAITSEVVFWVSFIGIGSAGLGFIIYVRAIGVLGVTPTALFSNFLPISTTIFGWIFFKEMISPMQIFGGIIVIIAAFVVIYEKGKVDKAHKLNLEENS
jgi:drug/metabolite transporter (DMT)-like permease